MSQYKIEGRLRIHANNRWRIYNSKSPYDGEELTSGDVFEYWDGFRWIRTRLEAAMGEYYAIDGKQLENGLRVRVGRSS